MATVSISHELATAPSEAPLCKSDEISQLFGDVNESKYGRVEMVKKDI